MRVLIDPGTPTRTTMGDIAMLQVAVARLGALWPEAELRALTNDPAPFAIHCPAATGARSAAALRRLSRRLPGRVRPGLTGANRAVLETGA